MSPLRISLNKSAEGVVRKDYGGVFETHRNLKVLDQGINDKKKA
jgi:hypothetical protein